MIECKVCTNIYSEKREHCPTCATHNQTLTVMHYDYVASGNGIAHLLDIAPALNAQPMKQNLYDGKILGLRIR